MSNKNLVLRLLITAKDEASGALSSLQAKAAAVAAAIGAYFTADFFGGAIKSAANFEAAMSRVAAATGATGDEFAQLKQAAEEAAAGSSFTQVETAQGLETLAKAGLNAKESITALPGVMALAAAGDIELAQSAEIVTRTVAGMGIAVEDTARIADVLAKGANASNTSVKGLAEALSYTAPTARSATLSLEQTVAIIGKFADGGIDASRAGTALNAILSQFIDPASKFRTELTAIGITTSDFDKALRQLAKSGDDGTKAILAVGTEAGPALRSLLNQGVPALDKLKAQLDEAAGSAGETAGIMGNNLNGAVGMLSGAWDALKIKLGEPVLPVITAAVRDLSAGLRGAIADGTVDKFGDALRSAFASGIEWARKFAGEINPAELAAKLQDTATKVGAFFDDLGAKATNAGNIVQTAWGVMSAGTNVVLAAIYKMGEVFSAITFGILTDVAAISEGMSKVTFGAVSDNFKQAAAALRTEAGAAAVVAEAYGLKSREAFESAAQGAEAARAGWAGLTKPAEGAAAAVEAVGQAAKVTAAAVETTADKVEVLGKKAQASGEEQKKAAESATVSVRDLRAEYDKLVAGGDSQGAAEKLLEIKRALGELRTEAKFTADDVQAAYKRLGLQSKKELDDTAAEFKRHYEAIKSDGTATADIVQAAFKAYAEKAIAANKGVASDTLKAEAAMRGLTIETDGATISIEKIGAAGQKAGRQISGGMADASTAINRVRSDAERAADQIQRLKTSGLGDGFGNQSMGVKGSFEDMRRAGVTAEQLRNAGYSATEIDNYVNQNDQAAPGYVKRTVATSTQDNYTRGIELGLTSAQAKVFAAALADEITRANVKSRGDAGATLGLGYSVDQYLAEQRAAETRALEYAKANTTPDTVAGATQTIGPGNFIGGGRTITVNLNVGGRTTPVKVTDQAQADALLRALEEAGLASR